MTENNDTIRLQWLLAEECLPEGFANVKRDVYDFAYMAAEKANRSKPDESDLLEGFRMLVDEAMKDQA